MVERKKKSVPFTSFLVWLFQKVWNIESQKNNATIEHSFSYTVHAQAQWQGKIKNEKEKQRGGRGGTPQMTIIGDNATAKKHSQRHYVERGFLHIFKYVCGWKFVPEKNVYSYARIVDKGSRGKANVSLMPFLITFNELSRIWG